MKITSKFIAIAFLAALVCSCIKDKGNYNYLHLSEANIKVPSGTISGNLGEKLEIVPKFTFPNGDTLTDLRFEWWRGDEMLSNQKSLVIERLDMPIGENQIVFSMIDNKTEIKYSKLFVLNVTSPYHLCWMVLSEADNNRSSLACFKQGDHIETDPTDKNYELFKWFRESDVYRNNSGGEDLGFGPVRLIDHNNVSYSKKMGGLLVINSASEDIELNGENMKKVSYIKDQFLDGMLPANFDLKDAFFGEWGTYLLSTDGKVYCNRFADRIYYNGYFSQTPMSFEGTELNVKCLIGTPNYTYAWTLFDRTTKAYRSIFNNGGNDVTNPGKSGQIMKYTTYGSGYPPLHNIGNLELIYSGYVNTGRNNVGAEGSPKQSSAYISIYKNSDGDFIVQKFTLSVNPTKVSISPYSNPQKVVAELKDKLREDSKIVVNASPNLKTESDGTVYFSSQGTIYWFNFNDCVVKKLDEYSDKTITALALDNSGTKLGVGFSDGYFAIYSCRDEDLLKTKPTFTLKPEKVTSSNKVVDIVWKNANQTQGWLFDK